MRSCESCCPEQRCRNSDGSSGKGWCQGLPLRPGARYSTWNRPQSKPQSGSKWQNATELACYVHFGTLTHSHQSHENGFLSQSNQLSELESHAQSPCDLAQFSIALPPVFVMWMNLSSSEWHWQAGQSEVQRFKATGYLRSLRLTVPRPQWAGLDFVLVGFIWWTVGLEIEQENMGNGVVWLAARTCCCRMLYRLYILLVLRQFGWGKRSKKNCPCDALRLLLSSPRQWWQWHPKKCCSLSGLCRHCRGSCC